VGIALGVWAIAFGLLATAYALPGGPAARLSVDNAHPYVGVAVHFDASASVGHDAGNGRIVAYRFDFGDGLGTDWQALPRATHAYSDVAVYTASVAVRDGRGFEDRASVTIDVRSAPPPSGSAPDLVIASAYIEPSAPREGDAVSVSVTVLNVGGVAADSARVTAVDVRPDGSEVPLAPADLEDPLAPGASAVVRIPTFFAEGVGDHTLLLVLVDVAPPEAATFNNARALAMTVLPAGAGPSGFAGANFLAVALATAALLSAGGAAWFLLRPRPPGPLEPPPPAPPDRSPPPLWPP